MPGLTNSQGLKYPTGTDRRCDFPEQWGDLADLLQAKINLIEGINNRTYPVVPACQVEMTVPTLFNNTATFTNTTRFDRLVIDTDNMTNLSADPTSIRPTRAGLYQVVCYAQTSTSGDATNWLQLSITGIGSGTTGLTNMFDTTNIGDDADPWLKQLSCSGFVSWDPDSGAPLSIASEVSYAGSTAGTGITVDYVSLGVYWWSDLP